MITLITGTPGAGKTLNTIKLVHEENEGRSVYYVGIRDCTMDGWTEISYEDARKWQEYPDGSVFLIDECDLFAGNTAQDRKSEPEFVRELARHRHRGMDFYLITQEPTRLHHSARHHVGRHFHFERAFNREASRRLEWQSCVDKPKDDYHKRQEAAVQRVKFPKEYYSKYKSAEVHTHKPRIPRKVWAVAASMAVAVILGGKLAYGMLQDRGAAAVIAANQSADQQEKTSLLGDLISPDPLEKDTGYHLTTEQMVRMQEPRIQDVPWSAPMYDELLEVKSYPRPQCVYFHRTGDCRCYTQQATPLSVSYAQCRNITENGYFNPYIEDNALAAQGAAQADAQQAAALAAPMEPKDPNPGIYGEQAEEYLATRSLTIQPGGVYRNRVSQVASQPRQP